MDTKTKLQGPYFILIASLLLCYSCQTPSKPKADSKLVIAVSTDANSLNPLKVRGEVSSYLCLQMFQSLIGFDYESNALVGILAESPPTSEVMNEEQIKFTYTLRKEAQFDSGAEIRAEDILFSLKLAVCPNTSYPGASSFYSFIDSLVFPDSRSRELSFYCKNEYFLNLYATGDFYILPASQYDSAQILKNYSFNDLRSMNPDSLPEDLDWFVKRFNDQKHERDPIYIEGSGPYKLSSWTSQQQLVLKRKENWWGSNLANENTYFHAYPESIQYEVIPDKQTALNAFKSGEIDLLKGIQPKEFSKIQEGKEYHQATAPKLGYQYIGFNLHHPVLKNREIREAFAHLVNKEEMIEQVYYGLGTAIHSAISMNDSERYNKELKDYEPDLEMSKSLLDQLKTNQANEALPLSFEFLYNSNNEQRKRMGLILQDKAKQIGIEINPLGVEWSTYLERIRSGDFDLFIGSINSSPMPPDFKNYYHSSNVSGGRNYFNYESSYTDSLINGIQTAESEALRNEYYKAFQKQVLEDLPLIYFSQSMETFLFSSRVDRFSTSSVRPNYWAPSVKISTP